MLEETPAQICSEPALMLALHQIVIGVLVFLRSETLAATPKPNPAAPEIFRRAIRLESVDFERFAVDYAGFAANPCDLSAW